MVDDLFVRFVNGERIIIARFVSRERAAGRKRFLGRRGTVRVDDGAHDGRYLWTVMLDDELDDYGFFSEELRRLDVVEALGDLV